MIIKYKTFNSTEEFEKWQTENKVAIHSVQPWVNRVVADTAMDGMDMSTELGCWVTYRNEEDD